ERVSHIVVMGIGEPFDNYNNLIAFLRVVNDQQGLSIGARHITVSTSGLAHKIYEFADLDIQINLAVSLHAPNDELRTQVMKINRAFPIDKLMKSIEYYLSKKNRRITFENILLKDVNDHPTKIHEIAHSLLILSLLAYMLLNPYNSIDEHNQNENCDMEPIKIFKDILTSTGIQKRITLE